MEHFAKSSTAWAGVHLTGDKMVNGPVLYRHRDGRLTIAAEGREVTGWAGEHALRAGATRSRPSGGLMLAAFSGAIGGALTVWASLPLLVILGAATAAVIAGRAIWPRLLPPATEALMPLSAAAAIN